MSRITSVFSFILIVFIILQGCHHFSKKDTGYEFTDPAVKKKVEMLEKQLENTPNDINKRIELAKLFLSENMILNAITEFDKVLQEEPESADILLFQAYSYTQLIKPELFKSESLLTKALEIQPRNADAHLNLAHVLGKLGKEEQSIDEFNNAIEFTGDPTTLISAHLGLMAAYTRKGELGKADMEFEKAYEIYPGISDIIKRGKFETFTLPPKIFLGDDDIHPSNEARIELLLKEIEKLSGEKDEEVD